MQLIDYNTNVT